MSNDARNKLAIALDTSYLDQAVSIAKEVQPSIGIAKVGLQLFSAAGQRAVEEIRELGMDVFVDVKLHDIPNTVRGASKVLGSLGARFLTVHASGGVEMMQAAVAGLDEGARSAGVDAPTVLAVTVLTSDPNASEEALRWRVEAAVAANCGGIVCAATDLSVIRAVAPTILTVVPGIRPEGTPTHDQARVATPSGAIRSGADILVIGRAVTNSDRPGEAAERILAEVGQAV
ncbi:orotidine-5'-phosphate decarboxylase [Nocardia sp. NPDC057353]|uniref:orotidine-5'-phosphate decarboxylase n=1 Tax=Nocardia sp. NPDC057353 TaxID=3346104 RepID=UPI0036333C5B